MDVRLVDATAWAASAWDDLAVRTPLGDAFQSHAWGELKRGLGWTPLRVVMELSGRPTAVCSVQERSAPIVGALKVHYAPRGPILLDESPEAARAALAGLVEMARQRRSLALTIDPAWDDGTALAAELADAGFEPADREVQVSRTAMLIPLEATDDAQHARLGDSTARNINKARRAGVTAEMVDPADDDAREPALAEFFEMHAATGRREGFLVRSRDYEMEQWRRLTGSGIATLWFAGVGRRDNGVLLLHCGKTLLSYAAGSRDGADLRETRANHLLQWEIMRWAASAGFARYDLGGVDNHSAPGIPRDSGHPLWNLYEFKRGFGAEAALRVRAHEHFPNRLVRGLWRVARRER